MNLAPIVLFVYNRPDKTLSVIESLKKNFLAKHSELYIFSDGINKLKPEDFFKVNCVREIISHINGFKKVKKFYRNKNIGLYQNITSGLNQVFKSKTKAIILEDDIVVSQHFLNYMNSNLEIYKNESQVGSICSNKIIENQKLPVTFFLYHQDCWGWATWKRSWKLFNGNSSELLNKIEKENNRTKFNLNNQFLFTNLLKENIKKKRSWAVNWYASLFLKKKLNLYSSFAMSKNIGFGPDSTNSKNKIKSAELYEKKNNFKFEKTEITELKQSYQGLVKFYKKYFSIKRESKYQKFKDKIRWSKIILKNILEGKKNHFKFEGPFNSWKNAEKFSSGYDSPKIIKKLISSAIKIKKNKFLFERDTVLFSEPFYDWKILYYILKIYYKKKNINVIDFGGSLGSTYFQHKFFLEKIKQKKWNIVEQKKIVNIGNKIFKQDALKFYEKMEEAIKKNKFELVMFNSVIQYIEEPWYLFDLLKKKKGVTIIINNILFTKKQRDILIIQKTPKRIYEASYPMRVFSRKKFFEKIKKKFKIIKTGKNQNPFNVKFNNENFKNEYLVLMS